MRDPKIMKIMEIMKFLIFEALQLSEHRSGASERNAKAQCSNNLQRRGFSTVSNTPPGESPKRTISALPPGIWKTPETI